MTGTNITQGTMDNGGKSAVQQCCGFGARPWAYEAAAFLLLVGCGVALRLAGHDLPNFAPVAAMALFAGYFFRSAWVAACVPLSVMAISDCFLGGYHWGVMVLVYGMLAFPVCLRGWLRKTFVLGRGRLSETLTPLAGLLSCGLMSSILFFVVTNFGVWCGVPHLRGQLERSGAVLRGGDSVLPLHAGRRPVLRHAAVRQLCVGCERSPVARACLSYELTLVRPTMSESSEMSGGAGGREEIAAAGKAAALRSDCNRRVMALPAPLPCSAT